MAQRAVETPAQGQVAAAVAFFVKDAGLPATEVRCSHVTLYGSKKGYVHGSGGVEALGMVG